MSDIIFVGNASKFDARYGPIYKLGFNKDDLATLNDSMNDNGWVNVDLMENKEGKWYMKINDYQPAQKEAESTPPASSDDEDDLPF